MLIRKLLVNNRLLAVLALGFASGLPLALTGATLQAWFTEMNLSLVTIGALTLIGLPYTLKFLWAPLLDKFNLFHLGRRRGWILFTQFSLCLALIVLANMDPHREAAAMGVVALLIAFLAATQDIAIDAYRTEILTPEERGLGASYYVFTWRVANLISGGLGLVLADYVGWRLTYEFMASLLFFCSIITYFAPMPQEIISTSKNIFKSFLEPFTDLIKRDYFIVIILFVIFYKLGDALALSLMSNFLLRGLGFSLTEVGLVYKTVSLVAVILGAFVGGLILTKRSLYSALLMFGVAQAFSNLLFAWLAVIGKSYFWMTFALFVENFCSGMSTAAFMAFLMSLCHIRYTATQYATFSAVASMGRVFLGPVAAVMVEKMGWMQFYMWSFILSFPGIIFLLFLKKEVYAYAKILPE
jgi:PAT family beta-lactamase induction signal transducer AmpG